MSNTVISVENLSKSFKVRNMLILQRDLTHKFHRYIKELNFCFRVGVGWKNKFQLARSTLLYHVSNFTKTASRDVPQRASSYAMKYGNKTLNLQMRELDGDLFIFHEIFLDNIYAIPLAWRHDVKTVIDLGANVGFTTIYLANLFPTARFICVEPNPKTVTLLRHNLTFLGQGVTIIEGAISDHIGQGFLDTSCAVYDAKLDNCTTTSAKVQLYTMQELINKLGINSIDILKIDIEGAEKDLFRQDTEWLKAVKTILIELHDDYSLTHFSADMHRNGFTVITPSQLLGNNILAARNAN